MEYYVVNNHVQTYELTWKIDDIIFSEKWRLKLYTSYDHNYVKTVHLQKDGRRLLWLLFSSQTMNFYFYFSKLHIIITLWMILQQAK